MTQNNKIIIFTIFLGFFISILITSNNLNKYDKNVKRADGSYYHQMIKADAYRYAAHGNEIKNQLKDGLNFFETGREHYTKYLPPRIYAAYYQLFDINLFNKLDSEKINTGVHFLYLLFQSLLYYFSIILLYFTISKIINHKTTFFIILFLCIEPTILQYHSSFWSESIFFSLQIILISLILKKKQSNFNFFIIGIFLTLLSFQKEYSIFYIIPIIIYFYLTLDNLKYKKFIFLLLGFFLVQSVLGYNNYKRSGVFYIMTADSKINLHLDLVARVMIPKLKTTDKEFFATEGKATLNWIQNNNINYNKKLMDKIDQPGYLEYRESLFEKDKPKFDSFIRSRTIYYLKNYPSDFIKYTFNTSMHILVLNPFHIHTDNNFISGEVYHGSNTHKKLIPYRIVYTLTLYLICLYGLWSMIKMKEYNLLLYLFFSVIYFYGLVSWHGNTRYFMPVVIYIAFFFGYGVDKLIDLKKILSLKKSKIH